MDILLNQLIQFYLNNAANFHHLYLHAVWRVAPQQGDHRLLWCHCTLCIFPYCYFWVEWIVCRRHHHLHFNSRFSGNSELGGSFPSCPLFPAVLEENTEDKWHRILRAGCLSYCPTTASRHWSTQHQMVCYCSRQLELPNMLWCGRGMHCSECRLVFCGLPA